LLVWAVDHDGAEVGGAGDFPIGGNADGSGAVADGLLASLSIRGKGGGELGDVSWRGVVSGVENGDGCAFVADAADDGAFDGLAMDRSGEGCAAAVLLLGVGECALDLGFGIEDVGEIVQGGEDGGFDGGDVGFLGED
jgi:hypothetical protein